MNARRHPILWLPTVALAAAFALLTSRQAAAEDCRISVDFTGIYKPGEASRYASFSEPQISGNESDCDESVTGPISVEMSRDANATIVLVAGVVSAATGNVDYIRPRVLSDMRRLLGQIQTVGSPNLPDTLPAEWRNYVVERVKQYVDDEFVEGRDPVKGIDGLIADIVERIYGGPFVGLFTQSLEGADTLYRLKKYIEQQIRDAQARIEPPDETWIRARASSQRCAWELTLHYIPTNGRYHGTHVQRCKSSVARVVIEFNEKDGYKPGDKGTVTVRAERADGTPLPLVSATVTGLSAVMPDGSPEPKAVIAGVTATFSFAVAKPRRDDKYAISVEVATDFASGGFEATGEAGLDVLNIAPRIESIDPAAARADPGQLLRLNVARIIVVDDNADRHNTAEIRADKIRAEHPDGLIAAPKLSGAPIRQVKFDPATGTYEYELRWEGRVAYPHEQGLWEAPVIVSDERQIAYEMVKLSVNDVAPFVKWVDVEPESVHERPSQPINITAHVEDGNGAGDIADYVIDATAAGGHRYSIADGLRQLEAGAAHRIYEIWNRFPSPQRKGLYEIPTEVWDKKKNSGRRGNFLHVGNNPPVITTHGFVWNEVGIKPPGPICPQELLVVGATVEDKENDTLLVIAEIVETRERILLVKRSHNTYSAPMIAPGRPGNYTLLFTAKEEPGTERAIATHPFEVKPCGLEEEKQKRKQGEEISDRSFLPGGVDGAIQKAAALRATLSPIFGGRQVRRDVSPASILRRLLVGLFTPPAAVSAFRNPSLAPRVRVLRPGDVLGALPQGGGASNRIPLQIVATGTSSGDFFRLQGLEDLGLREGETLSLPDGLVLEPVKGKIQAAARKAIEKQLPVSGLSIEAYCLDFIKLPPLPGQLYRVAEEKLQQQFAPVTRVLQAARRLAEQGALHPDSNPAGYATSIKQWSLWTRLEKWDASAFEKQFVSYMKKNLTEASQPWSKDIEAQVRALVPNRWRDINAVWSAAESADPIEP